MTAPVKRLRVQHIAVQVVVQWDDGDELTPGPPLEVKTLTLSQLRELAEHLPGEIVALEASLIRPDDDGSGAAGTPADPLPTPPSSPATASA